MSSSPNRLLVVLVGGGILVGLATAYRHWTAPAASPPAPSLVPVVVAADAAPAVAVAVVDAAPPAPVVLAVDASGPPSAIIDANDDPWFVEHTSVERGIGECGGMEEVLHPRVRHAGTADAGAPVIKELATIDSFCPHGSSTSITEHRAFDFDGDGVTELMLVSETVGAQGVSASTSSLWTRKGDAIVPYGRAPAFSFSGIEDVDDDGRPDLLSRLDYDEIARPRCGNGFVVAPIFVFHSLPNGDFTAKDTVAKEHFERQCSKDPLDVQLRNADSSSDFANAIVCARVHGATAEVVKRALEKHCTSFSVEECNDAKDDDGGRRVACPKWTLELAKKNVPTLR